MINWFNMPDEGLSNGGQFEIKELTATENKVYEKAGEVYNKVTVNVEGGGGSSDFSTAEVTVNIIDFEDDMEVYLKDVPKVENGILMNGDMYVVTATETITVPIAPNGVAFRSAEEPQSITGSATVTPEGKDFIITVTGDAIINYLTQK